MANRFARRFGRTSGGRVNNVSGFAFQIGLPELLMGLAILGLLLFGIWTVIKKVWAAFSD